MALLYRYVKLHDRADSHVFTFVVTRSVTRDPERDVTSKELTCGYQRWAITFSRTDKVLGVYLVWKSACQGMRVYVDFTFTLLNREHFSCNEAFAGKQVKFTMAAPAQGNKNYIPVSDLYARNFTDTNGEFQLELSIGHVRTVYNADIRVPTNIFGGVAAVATHHYGGGLHAHGGSRHGHHTGSPAPLQALQTPTNGANGTPAKTPTAPAGSKLETSYFTFGGFDWNLSIVPLAKESGSEGRMAVYINRLTGFDHACRVRYAVTLGDGDRRVESGTLQTVSDTEGRASGWHPRTRISDVMHKGVIRVHLEMMLANTMSEVAVTSMGLAPGAMDDTMGRRVAMPVTAQCYDREKQAWSLKSDCHSDTVRLHMVYKDVQHVPRNHLRYVCWTAYLLRYNKGHVETCVLPGAPFSHYYQQEPSDEGIIMETDLTVKALRDPGCEYLAEKGQLRVQVEWEESHMLFQATYHKYDDVSRVHNIQMRREIVALQAENYSLERQLFSYQKSIAYAHSRGTYSDDGATPDGRERDLEDDEDGEGPYCDERAYSLGDRSLSTDTEYA
ncbi:uncharacterized protein LOC117648081 [Thrips palmi]|uniref:Uncharacterized protein LOC117648081 n=1 Tax=Thrips palmi TaxID=161013 RepID=A0A6P8Z797_THRPL|nr:uncharacterized protein LOC117648081 [Thrips palmi]XP_034246170.1 uncharacterized protein LOC117648081 [Thrips palmi]XP_034246171.1 uncharacterized protein LOC117648081 [Thrips palmi]XP_034246172.1 uncharacterized protein LOC117648081 [Thrips palmi]XP_034246175.1 uncharacterized protein LOC117648081 [Thrips palmi]